MFCVWARTETTYAVAHTRPMELCCVHVWHHKNRRKMITLKHTNQYFRYNRIVELSLFTFLGYRAHTHNGMTCRKWNYCSNSSTKGTREIRVDFSFFFFIWLLFACDIILQTRRNATKLTVIVHFHRRSMWFTIIVPRKLKYNSTYREINKKRK